MVYKAKTAKSVNYSNPGYMSITWVAIGFIPYICIIQLLANVYRN